MDTALVQAANQEEALKEEFGPGFRLLGQRYFESVRFPVEAEDELRSLHARGFVVHVMRTTAWINFLYLVWALVRRALPPVRAVVNLRPWFTRPWRRTAQRGDFDVRFTYARRQGGSGLIFLKRTTLLSASGKDIEEDPFPALVSMARKGDRTIFLVPELFVWEKRTARLKPSVWDHIFGSPEAPGFLHSLVAFLRNYRRAQFRVGEPIDLRRFLEQHPEDTDELIARKVRSALHHHLARETRAVFGPPAKPTERLIEETLRDRVLRKALDAVAAETGRRPTSVSREAKRNLHAIAARTSPTVLAFVAPTLSWVFNRIYDGIEVDEAGLNRALKAASRAPIVLCASHKSHVDYLVLSWVLWSRGYTVPLVAAGANLSFFPLGALLRRCGAFFLRRSFKGDKVYAASFKAYIKKLVHDGIHQEFFPEGGRSRTGKLLPPKLGMFTWLVEAVQEGARNDLIFVPVSVDYEKVVESGSYSKELAGGEKKPEDIKALLSTPKVLTARYGRIHLTFDEPISLAELMKSRGIDSVQALDEEEQKKGLVRALGNRVMYGISKVSTVTPHALVSAALLAHRRRGIASRELAERISLLRRICAEEGAPLSSLLRNAPSNPETLGPIRDAMRTFCSDGMVRTQEARGELIYQAEDTRRSELAFYKNTLMNLVAARGLVANALLVEAPAPIDEVKARALSLSRLFKVEFIYRVGASFDTIFAETVERLVRMGLVLHDKEQLRVAPEPHARPELEFLADLLRDFLEAYLVAALTLGELAAGAVLDRKAFLKLALEIGRSEYHSGRLTVAESLVKVTLENAVAYMLDQRLLVETDRRLELGPAAPDAAACEQFVQEIRQYLQRS